MTKFMILRTMTKVATTTAKSCICRHGIM